MNRLAVAQEMDQHIPKLLLLFRAFGDRAGKHDAQRTIFLMLQHLQQPRHRFGRPHSAEAVGSGDPPPVKQAVEQLQVFPDKTGVVT
ncbi:hypothetical protein D3C74_290560 [compost metagenome]